MEQTVSPEFQFFDDSNDNIYTGDNLFTIIHNIMNMSIDEFSVAKAKNKNTTATVRQIAKDTKMSSAKVSRILNKIKLIGADMARTKKQVDVKSLLIELEKAEVTKDDIQTLKKINLESKKKVFVFDCSGCLNSVGGYCSITMTSGKGKNTQACFNYKSR